MKVFTKSPPPAGLQFPFHLIADRLVSVVERIRAQSAAFDPAVTGYVEYVLGTSGKRIRPALSLLAGGASGGARSDRRGGRRCRSDR